jgi:hypothetical protein
MSGTPPACWQGPAVDHPGTRTKSWWAFSPVETAAMRFNVLPVHRPASNGAAGKCRVFCARGWRVGRQKPGAQLGFSSSLTEALFRCRVQSAECRVDGHFAGNSVFRSRLVHLMQSAGPRRAKNRLGTESLDISRAEGKL